MGLSPARSSAHIITIDVIPEARRKGVGSALMVSLLAVFREQGMVRVRLEVDAGDAGAHRFYAGLGFVRGEFLPGYYQGRGDAYRMCLDL
jgi:ribosomal-protein-alanine N-acetyltransferase